MTNVPAQVREQVLVIRWQAGDPDAFRVLFSRYEPPIRYYLLKMLGSPEAAGDASQEVWLDVHRGITRLRQPGSFRSWLYRIARDRAFRAIRESRSQPRLIADVDLAAGQLVEEFTAEDAERIHLALDRLSPEHREVLLLRFVEDLPYEEIAGVTGCNLGTVKSRIHYAKRLLRHEMERLIDHE
jgi:RNA polymerase sigma-70 factor (ECF subfamily)